MSGAMIRERCNDRRALSVTNGTRQTRAGGGRRNICRKPSRSRLSKKPRTPFSERTAPSSRRATFARRHSTTARFATATTMPPSLSPAARRVARPLARRAVASARVLAPALLVCVLLALLRVRRVEALPEDASSSAPLADVRPAALPSDLIEGYHAGDDDALDAAMLAWLERTRASAASADPAPSPSTTTPPFVEGETGPRESPPRVAPASRLPVARAASVSRSRAEIVRAAGCSSSVQAKRPRGPVGALGPTPPGRFARA